MVAYAFSPRTGEAETGGPLSSRPAWYVEPVAGQLQPYREILCQKAENKTKQQQIAFPGYLNNFKNSHDINDKV